LLRVPTLLSRIVAPLSLERRDKPKNVCVGGYPEGACSAFQIFSLNVTFVIILSKEPENIDQQRQ